MPTYNLQTTALGYSTLEEYSIGASCSRRKTIDFGQSVQRVYTDVHTEVTTYYYR